MNFEVNWTCDLRGRKEIKDHGGLPADWTEITIKWGNCTRRGQACHNCTNAMKPIIPFPAYWKKAIEFLTWGSK